MDLFTYLMARKGKKILPHKDDLFAYLLGRSRFILIEPKVATGTTINITALKTNIDEFKLSKESTQDGTPTPENPVEVKTVKGYRNLFDKDNALYVSNLAYNNNFTAFQSTAGANPLRVYYLPCEPNKTYCYSKELGSYCRFGSCVEIPANGVSITTTNSDSSSQYATITTGANDNYIFFSPLKSSELSDFDFDEVIEKVLITEGNIVIPYVPYGTNWVYTTISDGTNSRITTIPLNNNEIAGIGDYKDELIVDENGHCWLNKKTNKVVLNGSESNWNSAGGQAPFQLTVNDLYRNNDEVVLISNYYKAVSYSSNWNDYQYLITSNSSANTTPSIRFKNVDISSVDNFKTWLSTHNTDVYYVLATEQLIDLNYNVDIRLFKGENTITNSSEAYMTIKYY